MTDDERAAIISAARQDVRESVASARASSVRGYTVDMGRPGGGVVYANIHPDVLARLERIEAMLTQLMSLPHNKRHDEQSLAEQPK